MVLKHFMTMLLLHGYSTVSQHCLPTKSIGQHCSFSDGQQANKNVSLAGGVTGQSLRWTLRSEHWKGHRWLKSTIRGTTTPRKIPE